MSLAHRVLFVIAAAIVVGATVWLVLDVVRAANSVGWPAGLAFLGLFGAAVIARLAPRSQRQRDLDEVVQRELGDDPGPEGGDPR